MVTSTGCTEFPENLVHAGETRPLQIVLVVDFKGFIHLKKQAQQRAK
jgi:hypothetical protein